MRYVYDVHRLRRWLRRLLLALAAAAVALVVMELWLRHSMSAFRGPAFDLRMYRADADGHPETVPGYVGTVTYAGRTTSVRLNALGMRGAEVGPRLEGERRILVVGDSMVFGVGVEVEETFASRLEALIEERTGRPATVRGAGAPGFGTFDCARVLRAARPAYRPDLVLASVFLGNDLSDNFEASVAVVDGYLLFGPLARIANQSLRLRMALRYRVWFLVEDFLRKHVQSLAVQIPDVTPDLTAFADFPPESQRVGALFMDRIEETPQNRRILDRLTEGLAQVKAAAGRVPVVVLLLPTPLQCSKAGYRSSLEALGLPPERFARGVLQRRIGERCAGLGLEMIDATVAFEGDDVAPWFLPNDVHLSAAGHERLARFLIDALSDRLR